MLNFLFYLCVFTLSLGQFSAILKQGEANVYLFDVAIVVFCLYGLFKFLVVERKFQLPKKSILFMVFSVVAAVSLFRVSYLYSAFELLVSAFYLFRWVSYLLAALVVYNMIAARYITKERVFTAFIYSGVFISLAGFAQMLLLPDFETLDPLLGWDPHKNRLASTFFDPNFTGAYLCLVLIILLERFFKSDHKKPFPALIIILIALFLTFSRSTWIMIAVIVLIYGFFKSKKLLLLSLLICFLAYFAVPRIQTRLAGVTDPADSAYFRFISWTNTYKIIQDHWLLGTGFNTFRYVQKDYGFLDADTFLKHSGAGSDSSLLFVLGTTGIIGLLVFVASLIYSIVATPKNEKIILLALIIGLFFESQFVNSFFYPPIMLFLLISCLI